MSQHAALPARYDHVGSFLRPKYLLEAREQKAKGEITPEQLRTVEDRPSPRSSVSRKTSASRASPTASSAARTSTSTFSISSAA